MLVGMDLKNNVIISICKFSEEIEKSLIKTINQSTCFKLFDPFSYEPDYDEGEEQIGKTATANQVF
jgi:hypothetical protein